MSKSSCRCHSLARRDGEYNLQHQSRWFSLAAEKYAKNTEKTATTATTTKKSTTTTQIKR